MIINRKVVASVTAEIRNIMAKISKGINHGSTFAIRELLTNVVGAVDNVEFIFDKMKR
jgi:hypothetical protein